jgi:hypothetical protein
MKHYPIPPDPPGRQFFNQNRTKYPPEDVLPYSNQYVAWQADGTRILTSAPTWEEVEEKLRAMGIDPSQVVFEWIPDPDVSYL